MSEVITIPLDEEEVAKQFEALTHEACIRLAYDTGFALSFFGGEKNPFDVGTAPEMFAAWARGRTDGHKQVFEQLKLEDCYGIDYPKGM